MAAASSLLSQDQCLCSICLDVFIDPVTTPCGHNFCKTCITQHWNCNVRCVCPLCNEAFIRRPEMKVNTFISEMVAAIRQSAENHASRRSEPADKPGDVECDICTGTKLKAIKSCLKCEASYCQAHLEPHLTAERLKSHQLIQPVANLDDRMCRQHHKSLELFCKTDQMCLCVLCTVLNHKNHSFVPLKEAYEGKKVELEKSTAEIRQKIRQRQVKILEIEQSAMLNRQAAGRKRAEGVQVFAALKQCVEKSQADFIKTIEEKQKSAEKQAEDFIKELQQDISELVERAAELELLSHTEDHLHLLQSYPCICTAPPTKDWTWVRVHHWSHEGSLVKAVAQLEETISKEVKKLLEVELKRIQKFAVDVTLDPDTAHPNLILSDDKKQVHCGDVTMYFPDNTQRFDTSLFVLGKPSLSSGRFYYEVSVQGRSGWELGMARKSIRKKGEIRPKPQDGYWTVGLWNGCIYYTVDDFPVSLSLKSKPEKVGVFVDYEEGLVSFYDVDAAALIFSFTGCSFLHKLLPIVCPYPNADYSYSPPLIISAVYQTDHLLCRTN
ncbi:E3 ubiquitin-protein ligase TRIM39-like [Genypterus blacodes]|uniref:E3 ubiquitin-protein ligase TRIM39-like n=1 Tax=Genypterus blacodes TaxID=154954 RepID=UPI003F75C5C8